MFTVLCRDYAVAKIQSPTENNFSTESSWVEKPVAVYGNNVSDLMQPPNHPFHELLIGNKTSGHLCIVDLQHIAAQPLPNAMQCYALRRFPSIKDPLSFLFLTMLCHSSRTRPCFQFLSFVSYAAWLARAGSRPKRSRPGIQALALRSSIKMRPPGP